MRTSSFLILGAAMAVGLAARPAMADVHQIGSNNISPDHYTQVSWEHFEGPDERLQFVAQGDTLDCAHISVTYRDGTTHEVFSGILPKDSTETHHLPRRRQPDAACRFRLQGSRAWTARGWLCRPSRKAGTRAGGRASRTSPSMKAAK